MTCIVGLVHQQAVYLGADSAALSDLDVTVRADPKLFRNSQFLIGFTTSFRMGQLLRFAFTPPPLQGDLLHYMATDFVDAVRTCLKAGGYARRENEVEEAGRFLVGVLGCLFAVHSDYQVEEAANGSLAIGSGAAHALGALYAAQALHAAPMARLELALQAAAFHGAGVREPFVYMVDTRSEERDA